MFGKKNSRADNATRPLVLLLVWFGRRKQKGVFLNVIGFHRDISDFEKQYSVIKRHINEKKIISNQVNIWTMTVDIFINALLLNAVH